MYGDHSAFAGDPPLDWLGAGGHSQRTVADLNRQLRRFLDDPLAEEPVH